MTTQINTYEDMIAYFQNYQRINGILNQRFSYRGLLENLSQARPEGVYFTALAFSRQSGDGGAFIKKDDKVLAQGAAQMAEMLRQDKKLRDDLVKQIREKLLAVPAE